MYVNRIYQPMKWREIIGMRRENKKNTRFHEKKKKKRDIRSRYNNNICNVCNLTYIYSRIRDENIPMEIAVYLYIFEIKILAYTKGE